MITEDHFTEYAVECFRGFGTWSGGVTVEPEWWTTSIDEANEVALSLQRNFQRLGCTDDAVSVRLVSRRVTLDRTEWGPLGVNANRQRWKAGPRWATSMGEPRIAKTVVADANAGENCFLVDGEPFPWYITEDGPIARKIADDLYQVHVLIYTCLFSGDQLHGLHHEDKDITWDNPILSGIQFPWLITQDGFTYRASSLDVPSVELEFFAESVEGVPIEDAPLPADGEVRCADGYTIRRTAAAEAATKAFTEARA